MNRNISVRNKSLFDMTDFGSYKIIYLYINTFINYCIHYSPNTQWTIPEAGVNELFLGLFLLRGENTRIF